jgi:hypothetical protein
MLKKESLLYRFNVQGSKFRVEKTIGVHGFKGSRFRGLRVQRFHNPEPLNLCLRVLVAEFLLNLLCFQ